MKKYTNTLREKPAWSFRETSGNVMSQMAMRTGGLNMVDSIMSENPSLWANLLRCYKKDLTLTTNGSF